MTFLATTFVIVSLALMILDTVRDLSRLFGGLRRIDPGLAGWI